MMDWILRKFVLTNDAKNYLLNIERQWNTDLETSNMEIKRHASQRACLHYQLCFYGRPFTKQYIRLTEPRLYKLGQIWCS